MNLTTYFLKHPVISLVLNGLLVLMGVLCFFSLSVREYPKVDIPKISVQMQFPNASAELVESSVTNILEDQLGGVEGLETIKSYSRTGVSIIEMEFRPGISESRALVAVREAVGLAINYLPEKAKGPIIERHAKNTGIPFIVVSLESTTMDFGALTHYVHLNLKNSFRSLKGVASAEVWGQPYTYQITLDPQKLYTFGVNADEVYDALQKNNVSLPVGKFRNEVPTLLNVELTSITDFENLLIKEQDSDGQSNKNKGKQKDKPAKKHPIFLKHVAQVKLVTDDEQFRVRVNGNPGLCIGISKSSEANPLEVSDLVRAQIQDLQQTLPPGLTIKMVTDQADFIRQSLKNIESSILEAILFVLIIVFIFLRNIRSTLIPLVAIPISMIGSIVFLKLFGFSINIMTLLAMVLAVGLVVDDAIVVLENITRHFEKGLSATEASIKGAKEIGFAIIAMTLTLTSVYAPIAFVQGTVGQLFIEFAVALAGSVLISGIVALTLSPLMCERTLRYQPNRLWPFIDTFLDHLAQIYKSHLETFMKKRKIAFFIAVCAVCLVVTFFKLLPSELAPKEDRGFIGVYVPPISGKDINTIEEKLLIIEKMIQSTPEATGILTFMGEWGGSIVLPLKPISERKRSANQIIEAWRPLTSALPSFDAWPWSVDSGLPGGDESASASELALVISTNDTYRELLGHVEKVRRLAEDKGDFESIRSDLKLDTLGYRIDLDKNQISKFNLKSSQIAKTIEIFFSGDRSLSFQKDSVLYSLTLKGPQAPWTLDELYLTKSDGKHVSLGTLATLTPTSQPKELYHYNQMRSTTLFADLRAGEKIQSAMPKLKDVADNHLPNTYKKEWVGAAKSFKESSLTMFVLFILALIFIYAILSIQFENFLDPLIVLLTVPLACSGALTTAWIFGQSLNIYTQVGLITLIGLITKHGILIVEFANQLRQQGLGLAESIQQASVLRLRPILMTTSAMIFGAIPLVLSYDAGAEARHVIGCVLIGGLGFGTLFTLFILPTLCYSLKSLQASAKA